MYWAVCFACDQVKNPFPKRTVPHLYFEVKKDRQASVPGPSASYTPQDAWARCLFLVQRCQGKVNGYSFPLIVVYDTAGGVTCSRLSQDVLSHCQPEGERETSLTTLHGDSVEGYNAIYTIDILGAGGAVYSVSTVHFDHIPRPRINGKLEKALRKAGLDFLPNSKSIEKDSYLLLGAANMQIFPLRLHEECLEARGSSKLAKMYPYLCLYQSQIDGRKMLAGCLSRKSKRQHLMFVRSQQKDGDHPVSPPPCHQPSAAESSEEEDRAGAKAQAGRQVTFEDQPVVCHSPPTVSLSPPPHRQRENHDDFFQGTYTDDRYNTSDVYESDSDSDYTYSSTSGDDDSDDDDDDDDDGAVPHMYTLCYSSDSDNENNHWRQNGDWDSDTGTLSDDSCDADDEWEDAGGDDGEDKWEYDEDDVFQTITRPAVE